MVEPHFTRNVLDAPPAETSRERFFALLTLARAERFWTKVQICAHGDECAACCWEWQGALYPSGYGQFYTGKTTRAENGTTGTHRVMYALAIGDIPAGLWVLHRCDNRRCVNPSHLWLGTVGDNNRDAAQKGRTAAGARSGAALHPDRYRGEQNGQAVLAAAQVQTIRALEDTLSLTAIARQFGVSTTTVWRIVQRHAWQNVPEADGSMPLPRRRPGYARGESHRSARLTEGQVRAILNLRGTMTLRTIGSRFGVAASTIGNIMCRARWAHLDTTDG